MYLFVSLIRWSMVLFPWISVWDLTFFIFMVRNGYLFWMRDRILNIYSMSCLVELYFGYAVKLRYWRVVRLSLYILIVESSYGQIVGNGDLYISIRHSIRAWISAFWIDAGYPKESVLLEVDRLWVW